MESELGKSENIGQNSDFNTFQQLSTRIEVSNNNFSIGNITWAMPDSLGSGLGISWIIRFFWYSNNSANYSSGRIEYQIPSRHSFLCRIVTDKCQIVTDEPNGNFFHFQYESVYCQAVTHWTALVSSLESQSSVKVDWGVQVPRLLLCRSNFCYYLIYLL